MNQQFDNTVFRLMRDYIEKQCGIRLGDEKRYLIKTRLTALMVEQGCSDMVQLRTKAQNDSSHALRDKIVDAMTTNETLWFRDGIPFDIMRDTLLPALAAELASKKRSVIRIWCAACSTGQEPYSLAMLLQEMHKQYPALHPGAIHITATDISPTVLFLSMAGRYDAFAMTRGLPPEYKERYFSQDGKIWVIDKNIRSMVTFKKHNLQDSFSGIGQQDIVFCRNVLIYFGEELKRDILGKIRKVLPVGGTLFAGASESLLQYGTDFTMVRAGRGMYYQAR